MRMRFLLTVPVMIATIVFFGVLKTNAGTSESIRGWLWGGSDAPASLGWISMNNVDSAGNLVNGTVSYGVNIPASDGALSGYAWSENYGWISFNTGDLTGCPLGACSAQRVSNQLMGWARIIGIKNDSIVGNSGGWLGWVSLSSATTGSPVAYGVTVNSDNTLGGYAWSDELGWIDFSRAFLVKPSILKLCGSTGSDVMNGNDRYYTYNQNEQFSAWYGPGTNCGTLSSDMNVTSDAGTVWFEDASQGVITSFTGGLLKAGAMVGTESVGVRYNGQSITFSAHVACVSDNQCYDSTTGTLLDVSQMCTGATVSGMDSCGVPKTCFGTRSCGSNWQEVAP